MAAIQFRELLTWAILRMEGETYDDQKMARVAWCDDGRRRADRSRRDSHRYPACGGPPHRHTLAEQALQEGDRAPSQGALRCLRLMRIEHAGRSTPSCRKGSS